MARSSGKSTKKSGDTKKDSTEAGKKAKKDSASKKKSNTKKAAPKKATNKEKEVKVPAKKKATKKEPILKCEFCQKTMKDKNTLKIHERNCQTKKDQDIDKKLKVAMFKMKDDFEDEQQSIVNKFQKREDALQTELDEMRTVLRMELDRHRKELEMIRKVEKQVAEVAEKQSEPVHEFRNEPVHVPDGRPKAIDMIPTPLPNIPQKIVEPVPINEPVISEPVTATASSEDDHSTVPHEVSAPPPKEELPMEKQVEEPAPPPKEELPVEKPTLLPKEELPAEKPVEKPAEPVPAISGLSKKEVEDLVKSLVKESTNDMPISAGDMPDAEALNTKVRQIFGRLDALDAKLDRFNNDMEKAVEKIEKESSTKRIEKEMHKVSDKINDLMEDIGFGEDLSVSKIPPTILEIVYQATLDDIHIEIVRAKGAQDAEMISQTALEEVRLKTSGSELFMYNGRKIVTDNLASSIQANLISAKQIQTTYSVLLDKLLETVPHHKAKNFRAMIKVKSQEFAVDRATILTKDYDRLEKIIESTSQMVAAMSAQGNARKLEVQESLEDIKNNLLAKKASQEEIDIMKIKMQERDEKDAQLDSKLSLLKAEIEMKEQIKAKEEDEGIAIIVPGETIDTEEIIKENAETAKSKPDISPAILDSIQNGASSKTAIIRETELEEDDILEAIAKLVKGKKVIEKKIGKRIKYITPEQDINEKLKVDGKKEDPVSSKKAKVPSEKVSKKPAKKEEKPKKDEKKKEPSKKKKTGKKEELPAVELPPVAEPKAAKPESKKATAPPKKGTPKKEKKEEPLEEEKSDSKKSSSKKPSKKEEPASKKSVKKEEKPKKDDKKEEPAPEVKPEKEEEKPKEEHVEDSLPVITKKLEDLSDDERQVLDAMSKNGMTISGIQSKVGKNLKRFALLRALRVLIDSGYVGIITKGRMDLYQKINVTKMDKKKQNKNKMEVK